MSRLQEELAKAKKTSATSSKPPSSDIVKPKPGGPETDEEKRSIGGQPGHPKHEREPFAAEQVTRFVCHELNACPDCDGALERNGGLQRVVQQMDIGAAPLSVEQHTCPEYWCDRCRKPCGAPLPLAIERGSLVGPNLTALIAFMKGFCHASFSTTRLFLRDVVGVTIARSTLANTINKVSAALEGSYGELLQRLPWEDMLNIDETGHKDKGERWWTWCFRADLYTLYHIRPAPQCRGADRDLGGGLQWRYRLRLFRRLSQVHEAAGRRGAILFGPFDPRREVPDNVAGRPDH